MTDIRNPRTRALARERVPLIRKVADWFTVKRRQAIQLAAAGIAPLAIMLGYGSETEWEQYLLLTAAGVQAASNLLSLAYVRVGDWGKGWAIVRGSVYTLIGAAAPSLVLLGVITEDTGNGLVLGSSMALGAISNIIAIFAAGAQEREDAEIAALGPVRTPAE